MESLITKRNMHINIRMNCKLSSVLTQLISGIKSKSTQLFLNCNMFQICFLFFRQ